MTKELKIIATGKEIAAIIPTNTTEVEVLASKIFQSGMAPSGMKNEKMIAIAIISGLEVGLNPMQAINSIAVINGRPTMWGDAVLAVAFSSGLIEDFKEEIVGESGNMKAICTTHRKGIKSPTVGEFSVTDARTANLWGKKGPWTQYPKRMLQMRARAFALRDAFPDALAGIYIREEVLDYQPIISQDETKAVSVEELTGEPEVKDVEFEEAEIITAEQATDYITRITNAESKEAYLKIKAEVIAAIKDSVDSPLKKSVGTALRTKEEEYKGSDFPGDDNYRGPEE